MRVQWFFVIKNVAFIPFQMNRGCDNKQECQLQTHLRATRTLLEMCEYASN